MTRRRQALPACWLVLLALGCRGAPAPDGAGPSRGAAQPYRVEVTVGAAGHARRDLPVEVEVDFAALLKPLGVSGRVPAASLRVVEADGQGGALDAEVPYQFDPAERSAGSGTLTFLLRGETPADATRRFHVCFDTADRHERPAYPVQVKLTEAVKHEGQESFKIETPAGTYVYHKRGAGFASLFDRDGKDWLSYRPTGGSAGHYRGIPNLVHPEGYFHPGGQKCSSRIVARGPLRVRIASEAEGGKWACTWDVYPGFARLTVLRAARPYWFLYEGTPGGKLDEEGDYYVLSTGEKFPASAKWDKDIPGQEWLYFGDSQLNRVLYLVHHEDDEHVDAYWPMQGNMTVFGFGRQGLNKFLRKTPARFTVGLCEAMAHARVKEVIDGVCRPPEVRLGRAEAKEGSKPAPGQ